jgi:hypothetical protein
MGDEVRYDIIPSADPCYRSFWERVARTPEGEEEILALAVLLARGERVRGLDQRTAKRLLGHLKEIEGFYCMSEEETPGGGAEVLGFAVELERDRQTASPTDDLELLALLGFGKGQRYKN